MEITSLYQFGQKTAIQDGCATEGKIRRHWPVLPVLGRRLRLFEQRGRIVSQLDAEIGGVAAALILPEPAAPAKMLKAFEDALDAVVCAWVGLCALEARSGNGGWGFRNLGSIAASPIATGLLRRNKQLLVAMLEQRGDLMRVLILSEESHRLILDQARPPIVARTDAVQRSDGRWEVPVDDEVADAIDHARLQGESDDDVVSRLVRDAIGQRPS